MDPNYGFTQLNHRHKPDIASRYLGSCMMVVRYCSLCRRLIDFRSQECGYLLSGLPGDYLEKLRVNGTPQARSIARRLHELAGPSFTRESADQSRISRTSNSAVVSIARTVRMAFHRSQRDSNLAVVSSSAVSVIVSKSWD